MRTRLIRFSIVSILICIVLTACKRSINVGSDPAGNDISTTIPPAISLQPDSQTANEPASDTQVNDTPAPTASPDVHTPSPTQALSDSYTSSYTETDGYQGNIELDGINHPLMLYDGLCYVLRDDMTASVIYTFLSDDTRTDYLVKAAINYDGNEYTTTKLEDDAFSCFFKAESISLPDTLVYIGNNAFDGCERLTSLSIPDKVTHIGDYVFLSCIALKEIQLPPKLTELGNAAFFDCESLTTVTLPDTLTSIPDETFSGCEALKAVSIPDNVTYIGIDAFWYCETLTELIIPDGVKTIGERAFYDCLNISEFRFPKSLETVADDLFDYCDSLTVLYVPKDSVSKYATMYEGYEFSVKGY